MEGVEGVEEDNVAGSDAVPSDGYVGSQAQVIYPLDALGPYHKDLPDLEKHMIDYCENCQVLRSRWEVADGR